MPPPYQPVGRCIYCSATEYGLDRRRLGDEHIVPFCVDGKHILPRASCKRCEDRTKKLENSLFGDIGTYRAARVAVGSVSRRKQPKTVPLWIGEGDAATRYDLPPHEAPLCFFALRFSPPAALSGGDWYAGDKKIKGEFVVLSWGKAPPTQPFSTPNITVQTLCAFLGKIAHGYAVAELGLGGFEPFLTAYIRGKTIEHPWGLFGCVDDDEPVDGPYRIALSTYAVKDDILVAVDIRLFGPLPTFPTYRVVVGRLVQSEPNQISEFENVSET